MSSIRSYGRRVGSLFAVAALTLATITPGLVPTMASAAQLTERSIALSSSAREATGVTYNVAFTADGDAGSLIIDFCSNTPLIGAACTTPTGFSTANVGSTAGDFTVTSVDANTVRLVGTIDVSEEDEITAALTGITNPSVAGPIYARIVTYTGTNSTNYVNAETLGANTVDQGGAAISILDNINVSGAVLETLTFCVAGPTVTGEGEEAVTGPTTIGNGCTGTLPAPTLKLGKKTGSVIALDSSEVSTGSLYSQISTNAASGAIVNLKSSATGCGGLLRDGAPTACDIAPALKTDIALGQAKFGAKVNPTTPANIIGLSDYNSTTFTLNYNSVDQSTGVTSTYGDPFFSTGGKPVSNENLEIVFGASVAPNTPAGNYKAALNLIATGKF